MKRNVILIILFTVFLPGPGSAQYFVENECGFVPNVYYSWQNYQSGYHAWGFKLYYKNTLIFQAESTSMGTGYSFDWIKMLSDTVGFCQYTYSNISHLNFLCKLVGKQVYIISNAYESFILNARNVYYVQYYNGRDIYRWSEGSPYRLIIDGSNALGDLFVNDTIQGIPLCDSLCQLNYMSEYNHYHYCIRLYVIDSAFSTGENGLQDFYIYPNPAGESVHIRAGNHFKPDLIRVFDCFGELCRIYRADLSHDIELDISYLPSGLYLFEISDREARVCRKILKM
ncbi:MAG TPA: T9SS type A sorting domain-containing protein [Bacteroidales bacterium]|nr:T9SS type A sorting domain-containing protein [Bacteroidales bacterium]HSA42371.1 T9SS type A sorting domain-containing protein [Bacteroidales bacterium]